MPESKGVLRSAQFDDVYFSAQDGLAETHHVFLAGNHLPQNWVGRFDFVIGETGLGTGLNFLAVWKLFEDTAQADQNLHFISFEKFPLKRAEIDGALRELLPIQYAPYLDQFLKCYPENPQGIWEGRLTPRVKITVFFEDVCAGLARCETPVDAWFLDGFRPASNPDMWSAHVFAHVARLSRKGTTLATFTSAGFVRRGLKEVGFDIQKTRGFGHKREMSVGVFL